MKKLIAVILALVFTLSFTACGAEESSSDLEYITNNGKIVVGITDFAPMDFEDENGEWIGFDADMAKEFAEYLGVEAEFIVIDWDNKIFELENKSIDVVWNGMTLTDKVKDAMGCADPYCKNAQVVVVKADVADQYQDEASLADLAFAVEAGSAGKEIVESLGFDFTEVAYQSDALMEVAAGTSDACVIDLLMAGAMIGEDTGYPDLTYTVSLTSEEYVVGFRKGSDLVEKFNQFWADACAEGTVLETAKLYGVQESVIIK
ncbi:MAG: transporter substrate-binding domain-containing protein [Oscillospiraceae bacterium]|nr:transporter substrate-binding domain-containing protein [Oscillospiraceae bacterium]MBQ2794911.1 transporter substrate-binding domain-containing protein [Oscillospiraceae bacterium]MBQ2861534.1 transporter substrate-binding domain-containing protein [Oscillospiraceae bacterium]MBQ2998274.1 transporter substrate-binding domain-containing protein [Oscillospiraceae bacterium]MBQ3236554.1 transporter substrate-binding domain-containing protein [Oscillospiraceae bacterium]